MNLLFYLKNRCLKEFLDFNLLFIKKYKKKKFDNFLN